MYSDPLFMLTESLTGGYSNMQIKPLLATATDLIRIVVDEAIEEQLVVLRCQSR